MEKPDKREIQPIKAAKVYSPPKVIQFGKVRELTTGGTMGMDEMGSGGQTMKMA